MKYIFLVFLLLGFVGCQSQKAITYDINESTNKSECEILFKKNKQWLSELPKEDSEISLSMEANDSLNFILNCGITLLNNNNKRNSSVEYSLLSFTEEAYSSLLSNKNRINLNNHINSYRIAKLILPNIANEQAFIIGMKYFELSKDDNFYYFADDYGIINLGLSAFKGTLLPMMDEKSKAYYEKLYEDELLDYTLNTLEDENFYKLFQAQFYPIIKADWEAGKIKLRDNTEKD